MPCGIRENEVSEEDFERSCGLLRITGVIRDRGSDENKTQKTLSGTKREKLRNRKSLGRTWSKVYADFLEKARKKGKTTVEKKNKMMKFL